MADLTVSTQEQMEYRRENEWRRAGVSEMDIAFSRLSGMDARDVQTFREISSQYGLLIVVRCPKVAARAWHGLVPPKPWAMKQKTGTNRRRERRVSPWARAARSGFRITI